MDKRQSKFIIFSCLLISIIFVVFVLRPKIQTPTSNASPTPTPLAIPVALAAQPESVTSSDGKMTIDAMKLTDDKGSTAYTFLVTDKDSGIQKGVFTKTEAPGATLSIPANTFSPDDKYVFLKETSTTSTDFFVITSSGTLDISGPFAAKYQNYVITDVTGWAAPTLVVINTNKVDGTLGPSFWFDVSSKSFIQLSERFN
jgi:hypothetical protein